MCLISDQHVLRLKYSSFSLIIYLSENTVIQWFSWYLWMSWIYSDTLILYLQMSCIFDDSRHLTINLQNKLPSNFNVPTHPSTIVKHAEESSMPWKFLRVLRFLSSFVLCLRRAPKGNSFSEKDIKIFYSSDVILRNYIVILNRLRYGSRK